MKVLITGGAGFIGSNLCRRLSENKENEIWSFDNYSTGDTKNHIKGVTYIKGHTQDIENKINFKPDITFHLGEYSRVEQSFEDLNSVWTSNKNGTFSVLNFCLKNKSKLVYAGSSTKFGDGGLGRSQSPYGWTKASNTELIRNFGHWFGLDYAITYFYNAYGYNEIKTGKYATLIGIFSECMRRNRPLTVVKPGTQKRNFTHINDIVSGLEKIGKLGHGDNFGIGNEQAYSVIEVAKMFGGEIEFIPERPGNRMTAEVITDKTRALGWSPTVDLPSFINKLKKNKWVM